jgi:tetratricopeptide (TPR) repeat protein
MAFLLASSSQAGFLRPAAAASLGALFLAWGAAQIRLVQSRERWRDQARENPYLTADASGFPRESEFLRSAGRIREKKLFPPDYAGAAEMYWEALPLAPLDATLWMEMAQALLFQGQTEEAAICLRRSDALAPGYPAQRLQSIRLWHLLGDAEKGREAARRLGSLSPMLRERVLDELAALGYAPEQIFRFLELGHLPPNEAGKLARRLAPKTAEEARALFAHVPDQLFAEREFRREAVPLAAAFPLPDLLRRLWEMERAGGSEAGGSETGGGAAGASLRELLDREGKPSGFLVENLDLKEAPFRDPFFLGWQPLPDSGGRASASWIAPRDGERGLIRLSFRDAIMSSGQAFGWVFQRWLAPPGGPLRIVLRLRPEPPSQSLCSFTARILSGGGARSNASAPRADGWQRLELVLPARKDWAIIELTLERNRRANASGISGAADLGGLELEFLAEQP